jgi:hypothetical protein
MNLIHNSVSHEFLIITFSFLCGAEFIKKSIVAWAMPVVLLVEEVSFYNIDSRIGIPIYFISIAYLIGWIVIVFYANRRRILMR